MNSLGPSELYTVPYSESIHNPSEPSDRRGLMTLLLPDSGGGVSGVIGEYNVATLCNIIFGGDVSVIGPQTGKKNIKYYLDVLPVQAFP